MKFPFRRLWDDASVVTLSMTLTSLQIQTRKVSAVSRLAWLSAVREVCHPINHRNPIWLRETSIRNGPPLPRPTVPFPERHPYCEITFSPEGRGIQYVGNENVEVHAGAVMLLGPNLPHTAELFEYPSRSITVYFLPVLCLQLGPKADGSRVLQRFNQPQSIESRIRYPSPTVLKFLEEKFGDMLDEFRRARFGSELRLEALLMEILVRLIREEENGGEDTAPLSDHSPNWEHARQALQYIHEHYLEPIYVREIARAVRTGERQLNRVFHVATGMGCIEYLNAYRVAQAASLLSASDLPVTTVAYAVGFETLSHFNTTFRNQMSMSPTEFVASKSRSVSPSPPAAVANR